MTKNGVGETTQRSKIIVEIASGSKKLTDALFELKILLSDLDDTDIASWIDSELSGYNSDNVPKYREFDGILFGNVLQPAGIVRRNMAIPVKNEFSDCTHVILRDNITAIEGYEEQEDKSNLSISVNSVLANAAADFNPEALCEITNAWIKIPLSKYSDILNAVKSRVIDVLLILEKQYGNLDSYTINFGDDKDRAGLSQIIINVIHNGSTVNIGNNNKISKSKIGEGNGD